MKTYRIHLIRHGLTDANFDGRYIGLKTDLPLNPQGVKELRDIAENCEPLYVDAVYTSPLLRCRQSASVLFPGFEAKTIDELAEYDFGDFENKTAEELEIMPEYGEWTSGKITAPPNGEDSNDFIKRQVLGLNMIVRDMMKKDLDESAVIMHGGAIMMLLSACGVPRRRSVEWTTEPGHGFSILVTPSLYHSSGIVEVTHTV